MSDFFATATTPTTQPPDAVADTIENDGWFPDILMAEARDSARIDGTVTDVRLFDALVAAVIEVNRNLSGWKEGQSALGFGAMSAVPALKVAGISVKVTLYKRAVYSSAKADLLEKYRDFDTTSEGNKKAELMNPAIEEQRRNSQWAIADIEGRTRVTVDLI